MNEIKKVLEYFDLLEEINEEETYTIEEVIEIIEDGITNYEGNGYAVYNNENRMSCIEALERIKQIERN